MTMLRRRRPAPCRRQYSMQKRAFSIVIFALAFVLCDGDPRVRPTPPWRSFRPRWMPRRRGIIITLDRLASRRSDSRRCDTSRSMLPRTSRRSLGQRTSRKSRFGPMGRWVRRFHQPCQTSRSTYRQQRRFLTGWASDGRHIRSERGGGRHHRAQRRTCSNEREHHDAGRSQSL